MGAHRDFCKKAARIFFAAIVAAACAGWSLLACLLLAAVFDDGVAMPPEFPAWMLAAVLTACAVAFRDVGRMLSRRGLLPMLRASMGEERWKGLSSELAAVAAIDLLLFFLGLTVPSECALRAAELACVPIAFAAACGLAFGLPADSEGDANG